MTDITTSTGPIVSHRLHMPRLAFPKLAIGAAAEALAQAVGQAFGMAYVAPYQTGRPQSHAARDAQGRDPSW